MSVSLFQKIQEVVPTLGGWTTVPKAHTLASIIIALRPEVSCELGVWFGRGALSMALAHKEIGKGIVWAIDAWSAQASIQGQVNEKDRTHWNNQPEHDKAYETFTRQVIVLSVQNCVNIVRSKSQDVAPPKNIGLLVIDGNHGETVLSDVDRYAPCVKTGGIVYADDLDWSGGAVRRGVEKLKRMGFNSLYRFETGEFFQRV